MKALMGTAAVVVIATCGYFVYDNLQAKAEKAEKAEAEMKQAETVECRQSLRRIKKILLSANLWEGKTHSQRLAAISESKHPAIEEYAGLIKLMYEVNWEKCGPI